MQPALFVIGIAIDGRQFGHSPVCCRIPLRTFGSKNAALPFSPITARFTGYGSYQRGIGSSEFKSNSIKPVGVFPFEENSFKGSPVES